MPDPRSRPATRAADQLTVCRLTLSPERQLAASAVKAELKHAGADGNRLRLCGSLKFAGERVDWNLTETTQWRRLLPHPAAN